MIEIIVVWFIVCLALGAVYVHSELRIYRQGGDVHNWTKRLDRFMKEHFGVES